MCVKIWEQEILLSKTFYDAFDENKIKMLYKIRHEYILWEP